jgi:hypothetical protein
MARANKSPKSDQPLANTKDARQAMPKEPSLQYRVQGIQSYGRAPSSRGMSRAARG